MVSLRLRAIVATKLLVTACARAGTGWTPARKMFCHMLAVESTHGLRSTLMSLCLVEQRRSVSPELIAQQGDTAHDTAGL